VPATRAQRLRVLARTWLPWRKLYGNRTVKRTVQGVALYMPWSHPLPDYARARASYGQNLVELAAALARRSQRAAGPMRVLDVGANIGDSALQILRRIDGRVLCVEGDPYWLRYLRMNVGGDRRITVAEVLLTPGEERAEELTAVRRMGTTTFTAASGEDSVLRQMSARELKQRNPDFEALRLVKSDTDGFDPVLVPAVSGAWRESGPVLFFEFHPSLARAVGNSDPYRMWSELESLGYDRVAIWDNTGDPLGQLDIGSAAEQSARLEPPPSGYQFWDVAACRDDDAEAQAAFDELITVPFDFAGHRS
jgi:FkbM family methyltransferase